MSNPINPSQLFPLIVSNHLAATKRFYCDKLGFSVVWDMDGYLQVRYGESSGPEVCFMTPAGGAALGCELRVHSEADVVLSIPTANADQTRAAFVKRGVEPLTACTDKPWKWRSFLVRDPNGVVLDFFHVLADSASADAAS